MLSLSGAVLGVGRQEAGRDPGPAKAPPFDPGPLAGIGPDGTTRALPRDRPSVILYVDDACRFCAVELARWTAALGGREPPRGLVVVRAPSRAGWADRLADRALADGALRDADGTVGRALGVRAVPFLAATDAGGRVVAVRVGVSSDDQVRTLLSGLLEPRAPGGSPRGSGGEP